MISLRFNHKVTTFPSGLTLQYPQSPCRRRRVLFSWDSWNLRRASWPEWSVLRPGIRFEKLDSTITSVISSDTGQGNDAPRTERALCFRPNEPKNKKRAGASPRGSLCLASKIVFQSILSAPRAMNGTSRTRTLTRRRFRVVSQGLLRVFAFC